jgi:hypothetical protein
MLGGCESVQNCSPQHIKTRILPVVPRYLPQYSISYVPADGFVTRCDGKPHEYCHWPDHTAAKTDFKKGNARLSPVGRIAVNENRPVSHLWVMISRITGHSVVAMFTL